MSAHKTRRHGHAPAAVVALAVQLAEDALKFPEGTWYSMTAAPGGGNEDYKALATRIRALLALTYDVNTAARTLGSRTMWVRKALSVSLGAPGLDEAVRELKALDASIKAAQNSAWPVLSNAPGTWGVEAAQAMRTTPAVVNATLTQALVKLRRGLNRPSILSADRGDLGKCLTRAMRTRALAVAISDIADAAGADPMDVARAFVAARKGGAR